MGVSNKTPEFIKMNPLRKQKTLQNSSNDYSKIVDFYVNFLPLNFVFSENGLVAHKDGKLIIFTLNLYRSLVKLMSLKLKYAHSIHGLIIIVLQMNVHEFINFTLHYIANLDIPIKRRTFIEFRNGMLNVSPIGQNCNQEERDEFERYDMVHNIRPKMVLVLRERFAHLNLTFSIGGQISFDVCIYANICGYMYLYWFDTFSLFHFCLWTSKETTDDITPQAKNLHQIATKSKDNSVDSNFFSFRSKLWFQTTIKK
ncbi:hypothetical protein UlMin_030408 [Ulmus minor]